jgi:hypothetical protein
LNNISDKINNTDSISDFLNELNLKVVKVNHELNRKYILYKEDKILNYILITKTTKEDLLDELLHIFTNHDVMWYVRLFDDVEKEKSYYKAIKLLREYLVEKVMRVDKTINDPSQKLIFKNKEDGLYYFNFFQNSELLVNPPKIEHSWNTIKKILYNLCSNNDDYYNWAINWFAYVYQHPYDRISNTIIFIGSPGSGKMLLSNVLMAIFGKCAYKCNSKDLVTNFNAQMIEGKLLLLANEIVDQNNKYQFSNDLKEIITDTEVTCEKKFCDRYQAKNFVKPIFFSNNFSPIVIEDNDRRYAVFKSSKLTTSFLEISNFLKPENFNLEIIGFCYFLYNYKCNRELVYSEPIMTEYKQDIIEYNRTDIKILITEIIEDNISSWISDDYENYYLSFIFVYDKYNEYIHKDKLYSKKKFSAKLKINGFEVLRTTINSENGYYIKIPLAISDKFKKNNKKNIDINKTYTLDDLKILFNIENNDQFLEHIKFAKRSGQLSEVKNGVFKFEYDINI